MINAIDVIMPSRLEACAFESIISLKYLPWPYTLYLMAGDTYVRSVNRAMEQTTRDVLLIDDDARLLPDTFKDFERYYPYADIFGFKLRYSENGLIWHSGGNVEPNTITHRLFDDHVPLYLGHLASAVLYIKRAVVEKLRFAEDFAGNVCEDIDFSFRAIDNGFRLLYIPNDAIHGGSESRENKDYHRTRLILGWRELQARYESLLPYTFVTPLELDEVKK